MLKAEKVVFQKYLITDHPPQDSNILSFEIGEVKPKQIPAIGHF